MSIRWIVLTFIGLCVLGGLVAGVFAHSIEAALTMRAGNRMNAVVSPQMPPAPVATTMPTPTLKGMNMLAHDTFQRADQLFWGMASDGREWDGDANRANVFSIVGRTGLIAQGQGVFSALLGPASTNVEVRVSGSVDRFNANQVNIGAVLRWTDNNNWYKALIDGATLRILKRVNGTTSQIGTIPFPAQAGSFYTLLFRAVGAMLFAKVWPSDGAEPNGWMLTVPDVSLTSGFGGIRVAIQNGVIVKVTSFLETTVGNMN